MDDIPIPRPRTRADAKTWYCSSCGVPGRPNLDAPTVLDDPRYAVGEHECVRLFKGRRTPVQFVADWAWDRDKWKEQRDEKLMRDAFMKQMRGSTMKPEEVALANRYRATRTDLPPVKR